MQNNRYLKYYFSELENNPKLPLCLSFTQIYTGIQISEDGNFKAIDGWSLEDNDFDVPSIEVNRVIYKPLTRTIQQSKERLKNNFPSYDI
jgi:hypothetical protein